VDLMADGAADAPVAAQAWTLRQLHSRSVGLSDLRNARVGVTLTFALGGGLVGVFTARIPALVDKLTISTAQLSTVLFVWGLGAVCAMQALRFIVARTGSASLMRVAPPLYVLFVALVAFAPTYTLLLLDVGLFGVAFGAVEVAANAQGAAVERAYGRPLMNGMHAGWPVGAGAGGVSAAVCAQYGVSFTWCLAGAAALVLPLAVVLTGTALEAPASARTPAGSPRGLHPIAYLLGVVAFGAFVLEGAVTDWTGVLLYDDLDSPQALAALAYPMFQGGMLIGRLVADRLLARLGGRTLVIGSGIATTASLVTVAQVPHPLVVLIGVLSVGLGLSPLVPVAVSLVAADDPGRCDAAVAQLGVLGFVGLLAGPAMIGFIATLTTLPVALGVVAILLGSLIVTAGQLLPRRAAVNGHRAVP
jgi:MFS family permease